MTAAMFAVCAAVPASQAAAPRGPIYLGVLEPPRENAMDSSARFHVRVAFRFQDGRWTAMPHAAGNEAALASLAMLYPARVPWTIALAGKRLGAVSSVRPAEYSRYSDIGLENLIAGAEPPQVTDGAAAFATWMGAARYRPLVAVSEPHFRDPDEWQPFDAPAAMLDKGRVAFKRAIALDLSCNGKTTRSYSSALIGISSGPYRSKNGDVLIAMRPAPRLNRCEGPAGDEWQSVWFHLSGSEFRWIGNGLTLLDTGDYDGSGGGKLLFQSDGYNRDGYLLFDVRDDSKLDFSWSYQ